MLAFLVEFCRSSKLDRLIVDDASEAARPSVELDLRRLNACPKACCRTKVTRGTSFLHVATRTA